VGEATLLFTNLNLPMKRKKQYPGGGPTLFVQSMRLGLTPKTPENLKHVRDWVKAYAHTNGRPETVQAYQM
jgi:hypothetical protein